MDEVSKLATYEQVPKFAPCREVLHGAAQATAVSVPWTTGVAAKAHLFADVGFPFPVTKRAQ
jgi:hypothetical protein